MTHQTQLRLTILNGVGEGGVTLKYSVPLSFVPRSNETIMIKDWTVTVGDVTYKLYNDVWYVIVTCMYIDKSDQDQNDLIKLWENRGWKRA